MRSANDGWIVVDARDQNRQLLLHYDGTQWQQVYAPQTPFPNTGAPLLSLSINSLVLTSLDEGWAVGSLIHQSGQSDTEAALLLHYQHGVWSLYQG
jgi:hypothetical protein